MPDAKPDMGRLIQSKGDIVMDEVRLSEGKAFISGNLNADVLYVGAVSYTHLETGGSR